MNCNRIKPAPHIIKGKKDIPPGQISMTQITLYLPGKVLPVAFFAHSAAMLQIFKPVFTIYQNLEIRHNNPISQLQFFLIDRKSTRPELQSQR